jgi:hypothetical protein
MSPTLCSANTIGLQRADPSPSAAPFGTPLNGGLLNLFATFHTVEDLSATLTIIISGSKLLGHYKERVQSTTRSVPSEEWFSETTRMFGSDESIGDVFGQRYITLSATQSHICIRDFNPFSSGREMTRLGINDYGRLAYPLGNDSYITRSSFHHAPDIFLGAFETTLPYREITFPMIPIGHREFCRGITLDDERIMVLIVSQHYSRGMSLIDLIMQYGYGGVPLKVSILGPQDSHEMKKDWSI